MEMGFVSPPPYDESPHMSPAYQRRRKKIPVRPPQSNSADVPGLYRNAKEFRWERVDADIRLHPEQAQYIHEDGTTALHLAVMSRTGYLLENNRDIREKHERAPMKTIEALLKTHPDSAKVPCQTKSFTPLAYACFIANREFDLEDMEQMVQLILKECPSALSVFSLNGLSPVDVHILSYSQQMVGVVEDIDYSGRSSTVVLRKLLEQSPSLAEVRISGDRVGGPIEVLYRNNKSAFLKAVEADEIKGKARDSPIASASGIATQSVMKQVSTWWVWRWVILILKYGTMRQKKKGTRFLVLQAASGLVGCPLPVITLAVNAFPKQVRMYDEMSDQGNLPLHQVCSWPCELDFNSTDPIISSRKGTAIASLLTEYPQGARFKNKQGQTALELAVASGTTWDIGVRKLLRAHPKAVSVASPTTGLFPFMTAASVVGLRDDSVKADSEDDIRGSSKRSLMTKLRNIAKQDLQTIRTIYGLLRANPRVLIGCFVDLGEGWVGKAPTVQDMVTWAHSPLQQESNKLTLGRR